MAVVVVKSAQITNRDTVPIVLEDARIANSNVRVSKGVVTITSGNDIGSTYIICSVPAKAVLQSLKISSPDIGTTTAADVGLYRTTRNGSNAVVDADFFTAAVNLNSGANTRLEILNGNIVTLANMEKTLASHLAGDAGAAAGTVSDNEYDIVATLTGAADATGTCFFECTFTEG